MQQWEYCVLENFWDNRNKEYSGTRLTINGQRQKVGNTGLIEGVNQLNLLAQKGWEVIGYSTSSDNHYWTLRRPLP